MIIQPVGEPGDRRIEVPESRWGTPWPAARQASQAKGGLRLSKIPCSHRVVSSHRYRWPCDRLVNADGQHCRGCSSNSQCVWPVVITLIIRYFPLTLLSRWAEINSLYGEGKLISSDYLMGLNFIQVFWLWVCCYCMRGESQSALICVILLLIWIKELHQFNFQGLISCILLLTTPWNKRSFIPWGVHGNGTHDSWTSFPAVPPTSSVLASPLHASVTPSEKNNNILLSSSLPLKAAFKRRRNHHPKCIDGETEAQQRETAAVSFPWGTVPSASRLRAQGGVHRTRQVLEWK